MRKIVLISSVLVISLNCFATPNASTDALHSALSNPSQSTTNKAPTNSYPIVYGGQDISRSRVATADETVWSGQRTLVS